MSILRKRLEEIQEGLTQQSSSQKDEIEIMRAMLNDTDYKVSVYPINNDVQETFCPSDNAREIISSALTGAAQMNSNEASQLAAEYEFTKKDAQNMIVISKEFVNTYLQTGRRLPLGGRENTNATLLRKEVPETIKSYPVKIGVGEDGNTKFETRQTTIPTHGSIKVESSCPEWLKENK